MREYTVIEYEQEDFDKIKNEMDDKRAIEVLESLPDGWFPYRLPEWGGKVDGSDLTSYEICCAVWRAIDADVEPVVHAEWRNNKNDYPECTNCGYMPAYDPAIDDIWCSMYCPKCGAKMKNGEELE